MRDVSSAAVAAPYSGLLQRVLSRAVDRGQILDDVDVETLAETFPAVAYQRIAARGLLVVEADVIRVVDHVLPPASRYR
jgi:hypothetical protein